MVNPIVVNKEKIDEVAFEMVRKNGMEVITARNISKEIGCSTKPIYRIYENMDELKKVVLNSVLQYMHHFIYMYKKTGNRLLDSGLAYIHFAKTEKELFKLISMSTEMQESNEMKIAANKSDQELFSLISMELSEKGYSDEKLNELTEHMTIYTYGLAILSFLGIQNFSEEELSIKLKDFFIKISNWKGE